ncbi:MAG: sigma-E processing peptidase SpoIIGA, partial [Bacilli bacterium]
MKVYVDLVLFLNFFIDFLILMSVSLVLKRNSSLKRIVLSSIIGSLTIFILFFNIGSFLMFIIKFSMSLILVLVSFGYK